MQQLSIVTNYSRFSKAKGIELLVFFEGHFVRLPLFFLIVSKKAEKLLLYKKDLKIATA